MNILMVNKFLYPKGGTETYCFELADYFKQMGHSVQFFGMAHENNIVGNDMDLYVSNVDFKDINIKKIFYPLRIIYSFEAKRKIGKLIKKYKPDIIHLNNINFQITPSILYEIKKHKIPVVMTLHDFQLVCPNHMLFIEHRLEVCERCKGGKYINCIRNKCLHNSRIKSIVAAAESWLYNKFGTYRKYIDHFISPSIFLKNKMIEFGIDKNRITQMHNFITSSEKNNFVKKDYVLYFGRLSRQKGLKTFIDACKLLPGIRFVVAGAGEMEEEFRGIDNIDFVGFKTGDELKTLVGEALFSICPSECYENCSMSILESQMYGTPVIGANIGGIPELINNNVDGLLFKPGDKYDLAEKIEYLYKDKNKINEFSEKCFSKVINEFSLETYYSKLIKLYDSLIRTK